jgi:hypothetical protein
VEESRSPGRAVIEGDGEGASVYKIYQWCKCAPGLGDPLKRTNRLNKAGGEFSLKPPVKQSSLISFKKCIIFVIMDLNFSYFFLNQ